MNMVLDGLENVLNKHFPKWKGQKVNYIRYADDFIITSSSEELIIPAHGLIRLLNPVIRGWSNYHKGICAKRIFGKYFFQRQKWREDLAKNCKQITTFVKKETNFNSRVSPDRECLKRA